MRLGILIALLAGLVLLQTVSGQEDPNKEETKKEETKKEPSKDDEADKEGTKEDKAKKDEFKTTAKPPPDVYDPNLLWNFHFEGKKKKGTFVELLTEKEARGRVLVITHMDLRIRQSTRVAVVEHRKVQRKKKFGGGKFWKKFLRRSELFSLGWRESSSQYTVSGFSLRAGMKFEADVRPALEITHGGGEMAVYAEGYWSRP